MIVPVAGLGTAICQVALPSVSAVVVPATSTFWPTNSRAAVFCAVCCSETSVLSWVLALSCCSTCANCTSCAVNWLVSSGSSGFWFLSCVVSNWRNVLKLPAIVDLSMPVAVAAAVLAGRMLLMDMSVPFLTPG